MEKYYESRSKIFYDTGKVMESNPEAGYQTGNLPEFTERARNHAKTIELNFPNSRPVTPQPPPKDKKWRYMWRVDGKAEVDNNKILPKNMIPTDFPGWEDQLDRFGGILRSSCYTASELIAIGLGQDRLTFRGKMEGGTQLLGPTGSDLSRHNQLGDILAGFHYGRLAISRHKLPDHPRPVTVPGAVHLAEDGGAGACQGAQGVLSTAGRQAAGDYDRWVYLRGVP